jgi:hypothetical protein
MEVLIAAAGTHAGTLALDVIKHVLRLEGLAWLSLALQSRPSQHCCNHDAWVTLSFIAPAIRTSAPAWRIARAAAMRLDPTAAVGVF